MSIRDGCFLTAGLALVDQTFANRLNDVYSASGVNHLRKVYMYTMTLIKLTNSREREGKRIKVMFKSSYLG